MLGRSEDPGYDLRTLLWLQYTAVASLRPMFEGTEADQEMTELTEEIAPVEGGKAPECLELGQEAGAPAAIAHVPTGSEIEWGAHLPPETRAEVEAMRSVPPRWASHRRLETASDAEVEQRPYPEVIPEFQVPAEPSRAAGQPRASQRGQGPPPEPPAGPIHVARLFLPGVYERVLQWLAMAEEAMQGMRRGGYHRVPDLVVTQLELQPWARGIIWDCRTADACVPMEPSDEATRFPGGHQLDRSLFRRYARAMGGDADIAETVGRGGLESYSEATLDCLFSFHHAGFAQAFEKGEAAVNAEVEAEFASMAFAHPPIVPCRVCPRNVILQLRPRLLAGQRDASGRPAVEEYAKKRGSRST